jgi:hypothetical protein
MVIVAYTFLLKMLGVLFAPWRASRFLQSDLAQNVGDER